MPRRQLHSHSGAAGEKTCLKDSVRRICNTSFNVVTAINLLVMTIYYLIFVTGTEYIRNRYGASLSTAGFTSGIMVIGCLAGRFLSANLISFIGCRALLWLGLILFGASMALFFPVNSLPLVFADRLLTGIGVGVTGTATATIASYVIPPQEKGFGISLFSMSSALALALGPFFGIVLIHNIEYATIMLINLVVVLLSLAISLLLRELPQISQRHRPIFSLNSYIDPRVVRFSLIPLIVFLSYGCIQAFMTSFSAERGLSGAASVFFLVYAITALASRPLTGRQLDSRGENVVIFPLLLIIVVGLILFALARSGWILLLAGALFGLGYGNFQSIGQAVSLSLVTPSRFAQATSTFFMFMDLGIGLGPYLFGFLIPAVGYTGMFFALDATIFLSLILYQLLHGRYAKYVQR